MSTTFRSFTAGESGEVVRHIESITFTHPPGLPGLRAATVNTIRPQEVGPWQGWTFRVLGERLLLIAPPGVWPGREGRYPGKQYVYDVPLAIAAITWVEEDIAPPDAPAAPAQLEAFVSPLPAAAPIEREEQPDEPVIDAKRPGKKGVR